MCEDIVVPPDGGYERETISITRLPTTTPYPRRPPEPGATLAGWPSLVPPSPPYSTLETRPTYEQPSKELYAEIGRLTTPVNLLKKATILSSNERWALIERDHAKLSLVAQAELLWISRASL